MKLWRNLAALLATLLIASSATAGLVTITRGPLHQTPPPPEDQTPLAALADTLDPGDSVDYPNGEGSGFTSAQFAWNSDFWYCAADQTFYMMGKAANATTSWIGATFDEQTETWTTDSDSANGPPSWNDLGHIYGNGGQRQDNCDIYFVKYGEDFFRVKNHATGLWSQTSTAPADFSSPPAGNGVEGFPNLYGASDGAMIVSARSNTVWAYRYSNTSWNNLGTVDAFREGVGIYDPVNHIWLGGGSQGGTSVVEGGPLIRVNADRSVDTLSDPPIQTRGSGAGGTHGTIFPHPDGSGCVLIIENGGSDGDAGRVWYSKNNGTSWTAWTGVTSPFVGLGSGPRVSILEYGVIWHLSFGESRLWKPPTCP